MQIFHTLIHFNSMELIQDIASAGSPDPVKVTSNKSVFLGGFFIHRWDCCLKCLMLRYIKDPIRDIPIINLLSLAQGKVWNPGRGCCRTMMVPMWFRVGETSSSANKKLFKTISDWPSIYSILNLKEAEATTTSVHNFDAQIFPKGLHRSCEQLRWSTRPIPFRFHYIW